MIRDGHPGQDGIGSDTGTSARIAGASSSTKVKELQSFDDFWKIYPRKRDKMAAKRMYARALKLASSAEILRATKLYAAERLGKDEKYTQYPGTWLNAGGWGNYPPPDEPPAPNGFYASFTSRELTAWDSYRRQTEGMDWPRDKKGGWWFPTRWPPNHQEVTHEVRLAF